MSRHIAHLFIRDPISLFAEKLQPSSENDTDHFERFLLPPSMHEVNVQRPLLPLDSVTKAPVKTPTGFMIAPILAVTIGVCASCMSSDDPRIFVIPSLKVVFTALGAVFLTQNIQSTNWQSMRFKPPPANSDIGWRVEFRPMELQLTNFENAAFATFIVLLTRTILSLKLNFLIPISKVEANMRNAVKRDAVNQARFYFRKGDLITTGKGYFPVQPPDFALGILSIRVSC
ncbi:unnamed protein product [Dibothriocephalus latus]|uniref:Glutamate--cysteine ligase n=1 Tax=Dibothriocephalus latus TaxID=60516 RepID=A0A3P7MHY9_DIBLA|nr:unnamed protein product [Dibothriocephalus latus]